MSVPLIVNASFERLWKHVQRPDARPIHGPIAAGANSADAATLSISIANPIALYGFMDLP